MDKVEKLFQKGFNLESDMIIFPIRHHSPVCSYHLRKLILEYKPDKILIEGPRESEELKEYIIDDLTKPPVAIYYSFDDKKGEISSECLKYHCYYPFLSFSPEYVALKCGKELNIETSFIDLSYGERLAQNKGEIENRIIISDSYLSYSNYVKGICEIEGCRDFNEYYERKFEINGLYKETRDFVFDMYGFCYFARESTDKTTFEEDGTLIREKYMANCILNEKGKRRLVIVGGFHVKGILDEIEANERIKLKKINSKSYLMPYSLKECNSIFGYSAGMAYIGFYKNILEKLYKNPVGSYEDNVITFIMNIARELRKNKIWVSTPDEIECLKLAKGLLLLRGKREVGVYELLDGLKGSLIKGEIGYGTVKFFECIDKILMGDEIGVVSKNSDVPPLVLDFRNKIKEYRLKIEDYASKEKVLDIYKNPKHLEISRFFYTTIFLDIGFCELIKGPDILNKSDLNLIRRTFKYKWEYVAEAKLINISVYGGTLKEAATNIILERARGYNSTLDYSKILVWCYNMGLLNQLNKLIPIMEEIIVNDDEFISLVNGLYNINYLHNLIGDNDGELKEVLRISLNRCYVKICTLIPSLKNIKSEEEEDYIYALIDVYNFRNKGGEEELLRIQLVDLCNICENTALLGSIYGILYGMAEITLNDIINKLKVMMDFPLFIKGLILSSKDIIYRNQAVLETLNLKIQELTKMEFLTILPHLRFGFNILTPLEKQTLSEKIYKILNADEIIMDISVIEPNILAEISIIEEESIKLLKERWSFFE
ncbi:MAG: DUF5682 family protein [Clostridium sp.]